MTIQDAKAALVESTGRGIGNLLASLILWILLMAGSFVLEDPQQKAIEYVVGAVVLWPLALLVGRLLRLDLLARSNPLSMLYLIICGLQVPFVPLLLGASLASPEMVPWYAGIVAGAQFLLFAWLFNSSAYLFCALGILEVASLTGWLTPVFTYLATPALVILILLISLFFVLRDNARSRAITKAVPSALLPLRKNS